jgi:hypothetical protein
VSRIDTADYNIDLKGLTPEIPEIPEIFRLPSLDQFYTREVSLRSLQCFL